MLSWAVRPPSPSVSVSAEGTAVTRDLSAGLSDTGIIAARSIPECKRELPKLEEAILLSREGGQHGDPGHQVPRCSEARVYRLRSAGSRVTIWQRARGGWLWGAELQGPTASGLPPLSLV